MIKTSPGSFMKQDKDGFWFKVSDNVAKEKIHHLFRTGRENERQGLHTSKRKGTNNDNVNHVAATDSSDNDRSKRVKIMGKEIFLVPDDNEGLS